MNVLSLFDGMSGAQIALKELGVNVDNYFASEIDKFAIKQTDINFPNTIQLGDITKINVKDLPKIDLIIAGSPCQGFSFAGKQLNFKDPRSALFFEFVRILNELKSINPNIKFLLENVNMKREHLGVISKYVGVFPCRINSNKVSAQNRDRHYWTNIRTRKEGIFNELWSDIPQPKDEGILLKDILQPESEIDEKYYLSDKSISNQITNIRSRLEYDFDNKSGALLANQSKQGSDMLCVAIRGRESTCLTQKRTEYGKQIRKDYESGKIKEQRKNIQKLEPRNDGKTNCITSVSKDNLIMQINSSKESGGNQPYQQNRVYDVSGQFPALSAGLGGRNNILVREATKKGYVEIKPGQCVDLENPNSKTRRGRKMDNKANCLMYSQNNFAKYTEYYKLRRLTVIECARLQTVPSWYKWIVSDSQAYKMLGNGFTIKVIEHILKHL